MIYKHTIVRPIHCILRKQNKAKCFFQFSLATNIVYCTKIFATLPGQLLPKIYLILFSFGGVQLSLWSWISYGHEWVVKARSNEHCVRSRIFFVQDRTMYRGRRKLSVAYREHNSKIWSSPLK